MRPEKKTILDEIKKDLESSEYVLLADCRGLTVQKLTALRGKLRKAGSKLKVTKNSFIHHAAKQVGKDGLDPFLIGPSAIIVGKNDISVVTKLLKEFVAENTLPVVKGGLLGKQVLTAQDIKAIADLAPKEVLQAIFVGTLAAPMRGLAGVLNSKVLTLLYALKAVEAKKSAQGA